MQEAVRKSKPEPVADRPRDLRETLERLQAEGDLVVTDKPVDPDLEITGLQKHLDGSCPVLFNNVKGKPNHRVVTNLFGDMNVINKMFGWANDVERTAKLAHALSHPLKPVEIPQNQAPCQEHVIEKPDDVNKYMVPIRHTTYEPELTVGSGIRCVTGAQFDGGSDLGYNRMNFRWGNVGTFQISPGSHMWQVVNKYYKEDQPVPITMCFGVPPACTLLAGAGFDYAILPMGCDEIGVAGAVQGTPIRLVKARTVDAMALADAEVVLEGYVNPATAASKPRKRKMPAYKAATTSIPSGRAIWGKSYKAPTFHVTAVTMRKPETKPIIVASAYTCSTTTTSTPRYGDPRSSNCATGCATRHRPGRRDPLLHDRLGRVHHPGEKAPSDRRRLAT
jgi:4-hydroxy-3-polyprenylbenzoate decarboxylase